MDKDGKVLSSFFDLSNSHRLTKFSSTLEYYYSTLEYIIL